LSELVVTPLVDHFVFQKRTQDNEWGYLVVPVTWCIKFPHFEAYPCQIGRKWGGYAVVESWVLKHIPSKVVNFEA
jgi:hypothetical protein